MMNRSFRDFLENLTEEQRTEIIDDAIKQQESKMLNSERKELLSKLKKAIDEQANIKYSVLRSVTDTINRSEILTEDQKSILVKQIWRGENEQEN